MVYPSAQAAKEDQSKLARQHADNAEDAFNQAGQHAASAASTVGHDIRRAGQQAAEAARYVGGRCVRHRRALVEHLKPGV